MSNNNNRSIGLDVMRASAIVFVLISHWSNNILYWFGIEANHKVFFLGELGVALFFALSGFLIGRILLAQASRDSSWPNLRTFLIRRWLRTLPLYFVVLAVLLAFYPPAKNAIEYAIRFGTMTQNLFSQMPQDYWFAVTWSLAVEEWFYLLFGAAVFVSFRFIREPRAIWVPIVAFMAIPLLLRLTSTLTYEMSKAVIFRLDEIAYGVAMAVLYERKSAIFKRPMLCFAAGSLLIVSAWFDFAPIPHSLARALMPNVVIVGCALLLPAALLMRGLPPSVSGVVKHISAQSYSLYLIHLTILVNVAQSYWWRGWLPAWVCAVIAIALPFIVSHLSLRYFETPILGMRPDHGSRKQDVANPVSAEAA